MTVMVQYGVLSVSPFSGIIRKVSGSKKAATNVLFFLRAFLKKTGPSIE